MKTIATAIDEAVLAETPTRQRARRPDRRECHDRVAWRRRIDTVGAGAAPAGVISNGRVGLDRLNFAR